MAISLQADSTLPQGYILVDGQRVASVSTTGGLSANKVVTDNFDIVNLKAVSLSAASLSATNIVSIDGGIGIGVLRPTNFSLHLANNRQIYFNSSNGYTAGLSGAQMFKWTDNSFYFDNYNGDTFVRGQNYATRIAINNTGDVGINVFPNTNWFGGIQRTKLHVKGDNGNNFVGLFEGSGSQFTPIIVLKPIDASGSVERVGVVETFNENNIAVISQYFILKPNGESFVEFYTTTAGSRTSDRRGLYGRVNSSGFVSISDYRIKTNVQNLSSTLEDLCQLRPITYKQKQHEQDNTNNTELHGFIAHEVQDINRFAFAVSGIKDAIKENGDPELQGLNYSLLVPALVKGIQELKAIVDTQGQTIASLQSEIAQLKNNS